MESKIELEKITELTDDVVDKMIIHSTRSSIRRAAAVRPTVIVPYNKDTNSKVPTLYYILDHDPKEDVDFWTIHALSADVNKFSLLQNVSSSSTETGTEG